jgi:hypothetical protein
VVREFPAARLVDHMHAVVVPILLGRGVRLWDGLEGVEQDYQVEATSSPSGVTHVTFTPRGRLDRRSDEEPELGRVASSSRPCKLPAAPILGRPFIGRSAACGDVGIKMSCNDAEYDHFGEGTAVELVGVAPRPGYVGECGPVGGCIPDEEQDRSATRRIWLV